MAQSETIREFLVSLVFKRDEEGLKKFTEGVSSATKTVQNFVRALELTGLAWAVHRITSNLEQLWFASRRVGESAANIKAWDTAMQNFGADAGEGLAALEGLAHVLRTNPAGNLALLEGIGVHVKRMKDGTFDTIDALQQFAKQIQTNPMFRGDIGFSIAQQYGSALGLPEHVLLAMRNPKFLDDFAKKQKEIGQGGWFNKAAEDAHKFQSSLRDLILVLEAFGTKVWDILEKKFHLSLVEINKWLQAHGNEIADKIAWAVNKILEVLPLLIKKGEELWGWFEKLDKKTDGWAGKLGALAAVLAGTGLGSVIGGVLALAAAFVRLGASLGSLGMLTTIGAALTGIYAVVQGIRGKDASNPISGIFNQLFGGGGSLGTWLYGLTHRGEEVMAFFEDHGFSPQAAAGLAARMKLESGFNAGAENAGHVGLFQWDANRQKDFAQWMIGRGGENMDMRNATFGEQLQFALYELTQGKEKYAGRMIRGARTAEEAGAYVSRLYARPGLTDAERYAESYRTAELARNISQNITININGTESPEKTGKAVQRELATAGKSATRDLAAPAY